jgi:hypothetical protein
MGSEEDGAVTFAEGGRQAAVSWAFGRARHIEGKQSFQVVVVSDDGPSLVVYSVAIQVQVQE